MEEWAAVPDFPGYLVSSFGYVRRENSRQDLTVHINNTGTAYVSLWKRGKGHTRSLALLVANAFLDPDPNELFDTPINLNGDRLDNRVENLMWRPNWFARKYSSQFSIPWKVFNRPILLLDTAEVFPNSWTAAMTYGLINVEIVMALVNADQVWPTRQIYRVYE